MEPRTPTHAAELAKQAERRRRLTNQLTTLVAGVSEITLEAGCGHGHWLTAFGAAHPDQLCIGLDLLAERIEKAKSKGHRLNLSNVHFVKAELTETLTCLPVSVSLSTIVFLFPDPWPKKRHFRRRMIQAPVLTALAKRATADAHLYFRTDSEDYFDWTRDLIHAHPDWILPEGQSEWIFEQETIFQRKMSQFQSLVAVKRPEETPRNESKIEDSKQNQLQPQA